MRLKKGFSNLELEGHGPGINHHGSDTPTSARAILHHTDLKGPNILKRSVAAGSLISPKLFRFSVLFFPFFFIRFLDKTSLC